MVEEDIKTRLQKLANEKNVVILSFVVPYVEKRLSPTQIASLSIGAKEEFEIEKKVEEITSKLGNKQNLYLLLDSRGGQVDSSYKIALCLRNNFNNITIFIPHMAASGATLIALSANNLVMGKMSHLTPIDVQVPYNGSMVSVNSIERTITRLDKYYSDKTPAESPFIYTAMAQKIDPILREEWSSYTLAMMTYTNEILNLSGYDEKDSFSIAINLIMTNFPHSFVINKKRARQYKLKVFDENEYEKELSLMKEWLKEFIYQEKVGHHIEYILPQKEQDK